MLKLKNFLRLHTVTYTVKMLQDRAVVARDH